MPQTISRENSLFQYGGNPLTLSNVRISKTHVQSNDKKVDGKIVITCGGKTIFSEKLKYGWVETNGILGNNATIRIETKKKEDLKYTVYYMAMTTHQDQTNAMARK